MTQVTITGNAWDGGLTPIPSTNEPELWFRPLTTSMERGLITDREIPAKTFNVSTGAFTVDLESEQGLIYIPILRWLKNPEDPMNRARGQSEWPAFAPGTGGDISSLAPLTHLRGVIAGFGPVFSWPTPIVYLNLSEPSGKIGVYGPANALVAGGA